MCGFLRASISLFRYIALLRRNPVTAQDRRYTSRLDGKDVGCQESKRGEEEDQARPGELDL